MKQILFIAAALVLLLSTACAQATPTVDPAQIQASAVAAANTMVAMTQAAIPTATEVPPTPLPSPTELPSPTPQSVATLDLTFPTASAPTAASGSTSTSSDPCAPDAPYKPMDPGAPGPSIRNLNLSNTTAGNVILSLYLNKTKFGQCGGTSFHLGPHQDLSTSTMKIGCYDAGAFITGKTTSKAFGHFCILDDTHKWNVVISNDVIRLVGP